MHNSFTRRTYTDFGQFISDLFFPLAQSGEIKSLQKKGEISPAFRERLMLAVTGVNKCRYCTWAHTKEALKSGVNRDEINSLLASDFKTCPPDEIPAILYAQHWAESNARPDPEMVARLHEIYGEGKSHDIHLILRMIRAGNLTGNTLDYFLHRISFGRWGGKTPSTA